MRQSPTLVLLPGNLCDERMWTPLLPAFGSMKVHHYVPRKDTIFAMARGCLSQFSGPLILVGFSMGAIMALAMAEFAPGRISAIALLDTNAGADKPERSDLRLRQQEDVGNGKLAAVVMEELKPAYFARQHRNNQALRTLVLDMAQSLGPEVFIAQSEALRTRPSFKHVLPTLLRPVFIACGAEDDLCSPSMHKDMAQQAETQDCHVIEGAGHMLPLEQPERLAAVLAPWLMGLKLA